MISRGTGKVIRDENGDLIKIQRTTKIWVHPEKRVKFWLDFHISERTNHH